MDSFDVEFEEITRDRHSNDLSTSFSPQSFTDVSPTAHSYYGENSRDVGQASIAEANLVQPVILSSSPPGHVMDLAEFSAWTLMASVGKSAISDILCWTDESSTKHTFLILRLPCRDSTHSESLTSYDLKIEPQESLESGRHTLKISFSPSTSQDHLCRTAKLNIGFLDFVKLTSDASREAPVPFLSLAAFRVRNKQKESDAPPPTLRDISRYMHRVEAMVLSSSGFKSNPSLHFCFGLVQAIGLRHHSFKRAISSRTKEVNSDYIIQPDGFLLGRTSGHGFRQWVMDSSSSIRNAVVKDVTWWRSRTGLIQVLFHQFVVITVEYSSGDDSPPTSYDLKVEIRDKGRNLGWEAEQQVTISPAAPLQEYLAENSLLLGLIGSSQRENSIHRDVPPSIQIATAFRDVLDFKWRGPPATLGHVARYMYTIDRLAPRHSLMSTNSYFLPRLLTHCLALRHYSFSSVAMTSSADLAPLSRTHDASTLSPIFLFLLQREASSAYLLFGGLSLILNFGLALVTILCLAVMGGVMGFLSDTFVWASGALLIIYFIVIFCAVKLEDRFVKPRASQIAATGTAKLVELLDDDPTLTHPNAKRGQYLEWQSFFEQAYTDEETSDLRATSSPWVHREQEYENLPTTYDGFPVEVRP